ncbi:MAG: hypothetical protein A4E64_01868 [Syntrophorhabdus sp. PtaU1.Bin058]|nr:MAG: hypothetical protein A4E64_01868 [Syntrophorhabdus sp. PtaU1.Bin058]
MCDFFLLPFLIGDKDCLPCIVIHYDGPGIHFLEALILNPLKVNQRKYQAVGDKWSEFLHQIERKTRSPRPVPVEKSHGRIESHCLQSGPYVMHEQCIDKGQQTIHIIKRRPPVPFIETECILLGNDQVIEYTEIDMGRVTLYSTQKIQWIILIEEIELMV